MRPKSIAISIVLLLATAGTLLFIASRISKRSSPPPAQGEVIIENPYAAEFQLPEFELTDRRGDPITHETLDGQLTVLDFFFTSCPLWCPGMTQAMAQVQSDTTGLDIQFMSISIDGDLDTPEIIDAYATRNNTSPSNWHWATGDPAIVASLVRDGLKFDLGDVTADDNGARLINHPTSLILLGPDRRVIALYRYDNEDQIQDLIQKIRELSS